MRILRDLLVITAGLVLPLFISDIPFRINVLTVSLGLAAAAAIVSFMFVFRYDVHVRRTASGLLFMNGIALVISALYLTPAESALSAGLIGTAVAGWGYMGLHFAKVARHHF